MDNIDLMFERQNLLKKLRNWKIISFILLVIIIIYSSSKIAKNNNSYPHQEFIAKISIIDFMVEDSAIDELFITAKENNKIKALIIYFNSGGGAPVAGEKIYKYVEEIKQIKPVIVSMGSSAASAAYLASLSSDRIFAHNTTITGSVGSVTQTYEIVDLARKFGVNFMNFKSSPFKNIPNNYEKLTKIQIEAVNDIIFDMHGYFKKLVQKHRNLTNEQADLLCNGRIFTGIQAFKYGLIDEIGSIEDAELWLKKNKNINKYLPVYELTPKRKTGILDMFHNLYAKTENILSLLNTKIIMMY